jgi:peroxiredoxin
MMAADGSADFTRAVGLDLDLSNRGFGVRSQRYSMLVRDGEVAALHVEAPGAFDVSDAETMLGDL